MLISLWIMRKGEMITNGVSRKYLMRFSDVTNSLKSSRLDGISLGLNSA